MSSLNSAGLVEVILNFISERKDWPLEELRAFDLERDLVASTVLDSLAFVALVSHLEEKTGVFIDFTELDPSQGTSIRGLVDYIQSCS